MTIRRVWWLAALALALMLATGCQRTTTVILVRHAEREPVTSANPDPPLTAAGQARAQALVQVADRAGLSAIFVTEFQRTRQTAQPLATALGITPAVVNVGSSTPQHAQTLAQTILGSHQGQAVLVVGHSDTLPLVIEALGLTPGPAIGSNDFDRLFVVVKRESGSTRLISGRYGP